METVRIIKIRKITLNLHHFKKKFIPLGKLFMVKSFRIMLSNKLKNLKCNLFKIMENRPIKMIKNSFSKMMNGKFTNKMRILP